MIIDQKKEIKTKQKLNCFTKRTSAEKCQYTPLRYNLVIFLALLFAILLWYRGWQEGRLSDKLLGWKMYF
jgi:hypothetical protein